LMVMCNALRLGFHPGAANNVPVQQLALRPVNFQ